MPLEPIPSTSFRSDAYPPADQFEAWREQISVVFDVAPLSKKARGFKAEADAFHLGEIVLARTRFDEQRFERSSKQLRSDLLDHYLVQLYHRGRYLGEADDRKLEIRAGTVSVLDMAHPVRTQASSADCTTLIVPRDMMQEALRSSGDLHGLIIEGASGALLADYIVALERRLPQLEGEQAPHIVQATCDLLAACIRPTAEQQERAKDQIRALQLQQVTRFIDDRVACRDLSPETICAAVGLSRTSLYALLKPCGGVRRYVQTRRLQRVHAALADPNEIRPLMEIAECHGFTSHAHMTRAFRAHFGYPPSEVRRLGGTVLRARAPSPEPYDHLEGTIPISNPLLDDWIRRLRA